MDSIRDITIGWENGEKYAEVDAPHSRIKSRLQKLHEKYPDQFERYVENPDGSIYAKIPVEWIKISPKRKCGRTFTEEEKRAGAERLRQYRKDRASHNVEK